MIQSSMIHGFIVSVAAIASFLMLSCSLGPTAGGTDTGNGVVLAGTFYYEDGSYARNATVIIRPRKELPESPGALPDPINTVSLQTDNAGGIEIRDLESGVYVIEAQDTTGKRALTAPVQVAGPQSPTFVQDTLKAAGGIKGIIRLHEGGDVRKVLILVSDLERLVTADSNGMFQIGEIASGSYTIRFLPVMETYGVLDIHNVMVAPGSITDLDTVRPPFSDLSAPTDLQLKYDTLKQIVTLSWSMMDTAGIRGYNVYRRDLDLDAAPARINATQLVTRGYHDSGLIQNRTYEYSTTAIDRKGRESRNGVPVTTRIVPAYVLTDSIGTDLFKGYQIVRFAATGNIFVIDAFMGGWSLYVFDTSRTLIHRVDKATTEAPTDFDIISAESVYLVNKHGLFRMEFPLNTLDTITLWLPDDYNKSVRFHNGSLYVTGGEVKQYSSEGHLLRSNPAFRADGLMVLDNLIMVTGAEDKIVLLDKHLTPLHVWEPGFSNRETPRILSHNGEGTILVYGYHYNPNFFTLRIFDSDRNYRGKFTFSFHIRSLDVYRETMAVSESGRVHLYRLRSGGETASPAPMR